MKGANVSAISRVFIMAVAYSRYDSANLLLDTGINVNFHHPNGSDTPLMAATYYDRPYLMNRLIVAGADVNAINDREQAAVHLVKTKECLDLLIHAGADVNIQDKDGRTPLFSMVEIGKIDCSMALISVGADVNKACSDGKTVLMKAVSLGNIEQVEFPLHKGADVSAYDSSKCNALLYSGLKGNTEILQLLLKAGADVNASHSEKKRSSLIVAANMGHTKCMNILLDAGADVNVQNFNNQSALMRATLNNNVDCVKLLLQAGAKVREKDKNGFGTLPLYVVKNILWQKSHVDPEMITLIQAAGETKEGLSEEVIEQLRRIPYPRNLHNTTNQHCLQLARQYLQDDPSVCLKDICRRAIREHLLQMSRENLFIRVPHLGLPSLLAEYLLYYCSFSETNS